MSLACRASCTPVHTGHDDVGEQQIDVMRGENMHGVIAVGGGKYAKALLGQHADDDIAHGRLVLDEENGEGRCRHDAHTETNEGVSLSVNAPMTGKCQ